MSASSPMIWLWHWLNDLRQVFFNLACSSLSVNGNAESLFLRHWNETMPISRHTLEAILRCHCSQQLSCHFLRDSLWILFLACSFSAPFLECSFLLLMTCPAWPLSSLLPLFSSHIPSVIGNLMVLEPSNFLSEILLWELWAPTKDPKGPLYFCHLPWILCKLKIQGKHEDLTVLIGSCLMIKVSFQYVTCVKLFLSFCKLLKSFQYLSFQGPTVNTWN